MASSSEGKVMASLREGKELRLGPIICNLCDDIAISKCRSCEKNLCPDCKVSHRKQRASRDHDIVDIDMLPTSKAEVKCLYHERYDVKYFCETCPDICCEVCKTENHGKHSCRDISHCVENVKDMCQDVAKSLRVPFSAAKVKVGSLKACNDRQSKLYMDVKQEITKRKKKLVCLITQIADKEEKAVERAEYEAERFVERTETNLLECKANCENALTPMMSVVMGHDVNKIIKCIQSMQVEKKSAEIALEDVNNIENMKSIGLVNTDENIDMVSDIVRSIFEVEGVNTNPHDIARIHEKPKFGKSKITKVKGDALLNPCSTLSSKNIITSVLFLHKAKLPQCTEISKRIYSRKFLRQYFGHIYFMSYTDTTVDATQSKCVLPDASHSKGRQILTIDESRHIIASDQKLCLCNSTGVILSRKYPDDYVPDVVVYFAPDQFASLCCSQKKIRFYNTGTLATIRTHELSGILDGEINPNTVYMLVTENRDILVPVQNTTDKSKKLLRFSRDGQLKDYVPVKDTLFECKWSTVCIVRGTQILAATEDGADIYSFDLHGGITTLCHIDDVKYTWSIGIEHDDIMYITYSLADTSSWVAKYQLI